MGTTLKKRCPMPTAATTTASSDQNRLKLPTGPHDEAKKYQLDDVRDVLELRPLLQRSV
jgi:hypothetical protein